MKTLSLFCLLLYAACIPGQPPEPKSAIELVHRLITTLNSQDAMMIRAFLQANATEDVPLDVRAQRMAGFAMQGAPFHLDQEPTVTTGEINAVLVDKEGMRLNAVFTITAGDPPKIKSMRIMPVRSVEPLGDWASLPQLARLLVDRRKLPAIGITMIRQGHMESAVAGVRDIRSKETIGQDEPWSIGSIGKPICTTVIARLIEKGQLRWDETLGEALKGVPMQPGYESATLEQIMQHRGGIPQDPGLTRERIHQIVGNAKTPTAMRTRYVRDILQRPPIARPGERNAYSNAGYALLGHIAERVTGKPYETLVKELVFVPLGLKHSYTGIDPLPVHRPSGHENRPAGLFPANMSGPLEYLMAPAGGGLWMSTADLARFGAEHLKGLRGQDGLLKAATVQRLHRGLPEHEGDLSFLYACGWGIESNPGIETFHGHNGSNGTMRSQLAIFPKADVVVAAITNCGGEEEPSPGLQAVLTIGARYAKRHP